MSAISSHDPLIKELIDAGIMPRQCYRWRLIADVNDVVRMESSVFVSPEQMQVIVDLLKKYPDAVVRHESAKEPRTETETPFINVTALGEKWKKKEPSDV